MTFFSASFETDFIHGAYPSEHTQAIRWQSFSSLLPNDSICTYICSTRGSHMP